MSEADVIHQTPASPVTVDTMITDLRSLGLAQGMTVLVHSSLSALGWVCGGPVAVVQALERVLGPEGTLVMPTHSSGLSEPSYWQNPPVPEAWWETIRQTMPAYDPDMTPTRGMGAIPECFRKQRGTLRSGHPQDSFAAYGRQAATITANHTLPYGLGEESPLARLYDLDGWVLLLGVGHANNTSLHLAEHRAAYPGKKTIMQGAPVLADGERRWVKFEDIELNDDDFVQIGDAFKSTGYVRQGSVGNAPALFMPQRPLVDFAIEWMQTNRQ